MAPMVAVWLFSAVRQFLNRDLVLLRSGHSALTRMGWPRSSQQWLVLIFLVPLALLEDVRLQFIHQGDELWILVQTFQFPVAAERPPEAPQRCARFAGTVKTLRWFSMVIGFSVSFLVQSSRLVLVLAPPTQVRPSGRGAHDGCCQGDHS